MLSPPKHLPWRWEKTLRFAQGDRGAVAETVTDPGGPAVWAGGVLGRVSVVARSGGG